MHFGRRKSPENAFSSHKCPVAVLGKIFGGGEAWPLIIWEATTAERNHYRTN